MSSYKRIPVTVRGRDLHMRYTNKVGHRMEVEWGMTQQQFGAQLQNPESLSQSKVLEVCAWCIQNAGYEDITFDWILDTDIEDLGPLVEAMGKAFEASIGDLGNVVEAAKAAKAEKKE